MLRIKKIILRILTIIIIVQDNKHNACAILRIATNLKSVLPWLIF